MISSQETCWKRTMMNLGGRQKWHKVSCLTLVRPVFCRFFNQTVSGRSIDHGPERLHPAGKEDPEMMYLTEQGKHAAGNPCVQISVL